jgi:hypothetical protein
MASCGISSRCGEGEGRELHSSGLVDRRPLFSSGSPKFSPSRPSKKSRVIRHVLHQLAHSMLLRRIAYDIPKHRIGCLFWNKGG